VRARIQAGLLHTLKLLELNPLTDGGGALGIGPGFGSWWESQEAGEAKFFAWERLPVRPSQWVEWVKKPTTL
jgi:hypothetical protein